MMASLDRQKEQRLHPVLIVRDREFSSSKEVLEDKLKRNSFAWLAVVSAQTN